MAQRHKLLKALLVLAVVGIGFLFAPAHIFAAPFTYVVNNTGDVSDGVPGDGVCETSPGNGICTLRAAIDETNFNNNSSDVDLITFSIAPLDGSVKTIQQDMNSSYYLREPVTIDGYTQDDAAPNTNPAPQPLNGTLRIVVDGSASTYGAGFVALGDNITVKGIVLNQYSGSPVIANSDATNFKLQGSYLNTDPTGMTQVIGTALSDLGSAVNIANATNVTIGGSNPEDRNVLTHNGGGIFAYGGDGGNKNLVIKGNNIMVASDGITSLPSMTGPYQFGILLDHISGVVVGGSSAAESNDIENMTQGPGINISNTSSNVSVLGNRIVGNQSGITVDYSTDITIGGSASTANIIAGNQSVGVKISNSLGVKVQSNKIGVTEDGATALGNGSDGINIFDSQVLVGGNAPAESNIIANNDNIGVLIDGSSTVSSVVGNSIYANGGLGIDIYGNGVTNNDSFDSDTGPNTVLNYPRVYTPAISGADTDLTYSLDVPAGDYRIEFFSNAAADGSGHGEGEVLIGSQNITSNGSGEQEFNATVLGNTHTNVYATATLIDVNSFSGFGPTSEFGDRGVATTDIGITKILDNPEDLAVGANLSYTFNFHNNGPSDLSLAQFDYSSGNPFADSLFVDYLPPDLTPTNFDTNTGAVTTSNPDISCLWAGPGSVGTYLASSFTNHTDYSFFFCWYEGSASSLSATESLETTIDFTVENTSGLSFSNYVIASLPSNGETQDPDTNDIIAASNSTDIIDSFLEDYSNVNNFASASVSPESDISLTKTLDNPDDVAQGATLNYTFTYTNHGPSQLHLSQFNDISSSPLILDFVAPDITPANLGGDGPVPNTHLLTDVGNPDIACIWAEHGVYAMAMGLSDHTDFGVVVCIYTGSAALSVDQSITATIPFIVSNDSSLAFQNYAVAPPTSNTGDPDLVSFSGAYGSGNDILTEFLTNHSAVNNFAVAPLSTDIGVTAELVSPEGVSPGKTVYYDVRLTNRGPAGIDFANYSTFNNPISGGLYAAEDLTLPEITVDGFTCLSAGPGSHSFIGAAAQDHTTYQLFSCTYSPGPSSILAPGASRTIRIPMIVNNSVSDNFNFYVYAPIIYGDPDVASLFGAITGASSDIFDTLTNDNYARVAYSPLGGASGGNSVNGILSRTGENRTILVSIALVIMISGLMGSVAAFSRRQSVNKSNS